MNEFEYAGRYLGEFKVKGAEIVPKFCPYCEGGSHNDRETFALNYENHTYNCKRGSCGVSGHFSELLREKGEEFEDPYDLGRLKKKDRPKEYKPKPVYKPVQTVQADLTEEAVKYLTARKITTETARAFRVKCDEKGNMCFPYYMTDGDTEPVFMKFRVPRKVDKGERKMWREKDTMPVLYNLHQCDPSRGGGILYLCEGEFDAMAFWQATGGTLNVTSVPSGAEDFAWIETCEEVLEKFKAIAVVGDNDVPGQKMAQDIVNKLSGEDLKVLIPDYTTYRGCKDANEILVRHGEEVFVDILAGLHQPPVRGLLNISDVRRVSLADIGKTRTGLKSLDGRVGGFLDGDITVWTGKRGNGKSTFLNQVAVQAVDDGKNVCIYSGEVPAERLKDQIFLCCAGYLYTEEHTDRVTERTYYTTRREVEPHIEAWLNRRMWFYDNKIVEQDERDSIIERFTAAYKQYDCRIFVVDNLMTVNCASNARDIMQIQADFVIRLRKFAEIYGVHVHIVVHPRKTSEISDADEVGGMGTITNIACNVFSVMRDKERDGKVKISCLKNRAFGVRGEVELIYDERSRRFGETLGTPVKYGWEKLFDEMKGEQT